MLLLLANASSPREGRHSQLHVFGTLPSGHESQTCVQHSPLLYTPLAQGGDCEIGMAAMLHEVKNNKKIRKNFIVPP